MMTSAEQEMLFVKFGQEIGELLIQKNRNYGNAFANCGEMLRLLYPNGLKPHQFEDALLIVRIWDKMQRIATGAPDEESPYGDIAGYGILGLVLKLLQKEETNAVTPQS